MVEAIVVISIFIMFFVGMVYFESLYHQQLRVQQLARAGALAYAMDACLDANALQTVQQDLGKSATGVNGAPTSAAPTATVPLSQPSKPVGSQGDALGSAMSGKGFTGDKITDIKITGQAAGTTQNGMFSPRWGFRSTAVSSSFMSCGDKQEDGNAGAVWDFVKNSFPMKLSN